jgi:hypothetical protein
MLFVTLNYDQHCPPWKENNLNKGIDVAIEAKNANAQFGLENE